MTSDPWQPPARDLSPWHVTVTERRQPEPRPPLVRWRDDGRDFALAVVASVMLLGPAVGLIWAAVAPRLSLLDVAGGSEEAFRADIGADFRFLVIAVIAGVVCALVAGVLRREGPGIILGLGVGGLAAAFVADRVGYLAARGDQLAALHLLGVPARVFEDAGIDPFLELRALAIVVVWPLVAVVLHTLVQALRARRR
ncbi:MAG TPA: hypothetical protein VFT62_01220 [Mycobacteriales bacterium]|nr:hypothetical protein [Mycobacteriales bacterium]